MAGGAHTLAQRAILQQPHNRAGKRSRVARRHEKSCLAVYDNFWNATRVSADDGKAHRHGVERGRSEPFGD